MNRIIQDETRRELVDQLLARAGIAGPARVMRRRSGQPPPLSFAQQRLWFLSRLESSSTAYNVPLPVRLPGLINVPALEKALNEVIRRHEVLRTTFELRQGVPVQVIAPELTVPLSVVDLRSTPLNQRAEAARQLANQDAARPFDLSLGPLVRARLVQLADEEFLLVLVLHHIVADAWSLEILSRELGVLYQAFSAGQTSPLPELSIQYGDFAEWQRGWLAGERLEKQLQYWQRQLHELPLLELPTDRPRPPTARARGAWRRIAIPGALVERLRAFAQEEGVTSFMLLLAIFKVLLHRYTGQEEIVLGTPIAGRVRPELEPLIGFFVNSLVFRTSLAGNPSFRQVVRRVRDVALDAYAHQDVPFEQLVEKLRPERDLSRNPLFQVMFQVLNVGQGAGGGAASSETVPEVFSGSAKFDLCFSLHESQRTMAGILEYDAELFDSETMARFAAHYVNIAASVVQEPDARVADLQFLEPEERKRLLVEWNNTAIAHNRDLRVHRIIEEQADRTPNAVAIESESDCLTYAEMEARSNRLARYLLRAGVGPDHSVAVCLERSSELIVAIVAILKAGGAYVPLDLDYPPERLAYMLANSRAAVVLSNTGAAPSLPAIKTPIIRLDQDGAAIQSLSSGRAERELSPDHLAYVIYTSGSTGRPKGVMVSHRAICNHMHWMIERFGIGSQDAVLQKTPISFDASVWEIFAPLMTGGRLVLARQGGHKDSGYMASAMRDRGITIVQLVPSQLEQLVMHSALNECARLRLVFCGGEPLLPELCQRFGARHDAELYNLYGPTEATIDATFSRCTGIRSTGRVLIGRPISNLRAYVLDRNGQLTPQGIPGLLHLSGASIARGYQNAPQLTAERFVPDPYSGEPGARMYCTGDLVRYRNQGDIEFLGRIDHQVKLRGYRIELHEIERVLEAHDAVQQAIVSVIHLAGNDQRLVAYVVCQAPEPEDAELRMYLRRFLPDYMMPAQIISLREMPRTPNGKINRHALPPPDTGLGLRRPEAISPSEPIEQEVAAVWREVLGVASIGSHDNFFDLGGHSLLLLRVHQLLQSRLKCDLPLLELFRYPTVQLLAAMIRERQDRARPEQSPAEPAALPGPGAARRGMMQVRPLFKRTAGPA